MTIIRISTTSKTGYELVDNDIVIALDKTYPGEPFTLVLPENSSNRKYFNSKKVDAAGGTIELTYKASIKLGPKAGHKPLEDYLNEEDRVRYDELMAIAKLNRDRAIEQAKTAKTDPIAKARLAAERAQAKLDELLAAKADEELVDQFEDLGELDED